MHLDDAQVQRMLDAGLASGLEPELRAHLETCPECQSKLAEAEKQDAWLAERLSLLDHPTPPLSVHDLRVRARRQPSSWRRVAAGIVLALATAGVAYAVPGSPVPRWVERIARWVVPAQPVPESPVVDRRASQAGIAVAPGDRFTIVFNEEFHAAARVGFTDGAEIVVRAVDGATFTSESDRLLIKPERAGARFDIEIPRAAPNVEIRVGNQPVFAKESSRISTRAIPSADGSYQVVLDGSSR